MAARSFLVAIVLGILTAFALFWAMQALISVSGDLQEGEIRSSRNPARTVLREQARLYPLSRMREIEEQRQQEIASLQAEQERGQKPSAYIVTAGVFHDEGFAKEKLMILLDRGYDGELRTAAADGVVVFDQGVMTFA